MERVAHHLGGNGYVVGGGLSLSHRGKGKRLET